jgi:hypothetical protein
MATNKISIPSAQVIQIAGMSQAMTIPTVGNTLKKLPSKCCIISRIVLKAIGSNQAASQTGITTLLVAISKVKVGSVDIDMRFADQWTALANKAAPLVHNSAKKATLPQRMAFI